MAKKAKPKKAVKKTAKKTVKVKSTVISRELPQTWGPDCFNEKTIDERGFQMADLKPRYYTALVNLVSEYGQSLRIEPAGNPGIKLSLVE